MNAFNKHSTLGDVMDEVMKIVAFDDDEAAVELIDDYGTIIQRANPGSDGRQVARDNIGYMAGYYGDETREAIFRLFECEHPILGTRSWTPKEASRRVRNGAKQ
jgi:hypothetical protein